MKNFFFKLMGIVFILTFFSCNNDLDKINPIGQGPSNGTLDLVSSSDPYNPVFEANSTDGFIYHWDMGNGQQIAPGKKSATSYFPFSGTYIIKCTIYGSGGESVEATYEYKVEETDPTITEQPVWKELTGSGAGKTWVYSTDPATGTPDYCFQTVDDLITYPDNWMPSGSWGQCVRITPDINGEMIFDLEGGINYTYKQSPTDPGTKGSFVLDTKNMTITIKSPFILDHDIDCTTPSATATGVYDIKKITEDEMVLWQNQKNGTGWSWSFKKK